jgi:hypothetical protein
MKPSVALAVLILVFFSLQVTRADSFTYTNGVFNFIDFRDFNARGINNLGQIVGTRGFGGGGSFLDTNGVLTPIILPGISANEVSVFGINDVGQIVGNYANATGSFGFFETNGVVTNINIRFPLSINNSGEIVGYPGGQLYSHGVYTSIFGAGFNPVDTVPTGINDTDQIVGYNFGVGFVGTNGAFNIVNIPRLVSVNGINDLGQFVGSYVTGDQAHGFEYHGFVDTNGTLTTIDLPGFAIDLTGINNAGEIIGTFTPIVVTTPEPSSLLLLASGLAGIVVLTVRRRRVGALVGR